MQPSAIHSALVDIMPVSYLKNIPPDRTIIFSMKKKVVV
jgi:hypothetical protein